MKKQKVLLVIVLMGILALIAASCSFFKPKADWSAYFPMDKGNQWIYAAQMTPGMGEMEFIFEITGQEKIKDTDCFVYESYIQDKSVQKEYYQIKDDSLLAYRRILGAGKTSVDLDPPEPMMKFPLETGKTWNWSGKLVNTDVSINFKVVGEEKIKVPAGEFDTFKIEIAQAPGKSNTTLSTTRWFAKNVGMIRENAQFSAAGRQINLNAELKQYTVSGKTLPEGNTPKQMQKD